MYNKKLVRFDDESQCGSVLDTIRAYSDVRSNHAAALLAMMVPKHPEWHIHKAKINGKGKVTPLADRETLEQIIQACPKRRRAAADVFQHLREPMCTRRRLSVPLTSKEQRDLRLARRDLKSTRRSFGSLHTLGLVHTPINHPQRVVFTGKSAISGVKVKSFGPLSAMLCTEPHNFFCIPLNASTPCC